MEICTPCCMISLPLNFILEHGYIFCSLFFHHALEEFLLSMCVYLFLPMSLLKENLKREIHKLKGVFILWMDEGC
jgi:hypothetical protein